jgi:DNA transformation protein and related proteins
MATKQSTVDLIQDQLASLENIFTRKMFGEYALYYDGKVVGLICDDMLFVKLTDQGKLFASKYYQEGFAYKGAKSSIKIDEERLDDREWLTALIRITANNLPRPNLKKAKQ